MKRTSIIRTSVIAILFLAIALFLGYQILRGDPTLLKNSTFSHETISPNADGDDDISSISYELTRNATISIYFVDEAGKSYYFRDNRTRAVGEYQLLFSGIVNGYLLPDEIVEGTVISRLLQNGRYQWVITATDEAAVTETATGTLIIEDADTSLPEMRNFTLDKTIFTPNRDGIDDRILIQFDLQKDANTTVYLLTDEGVQHPIGELDRKIPSGIAGRHYFDYEGGVDQGATPPADGTYQIIARSEDSEGQKVEITSHLTIQYGGVPRADIVSPMNADTVEFNATTIALCNELSFTLTIENYGDTPIRTSGPFAEDIVYDSTWNYNTIGWHTQSGVWRVAIGYENELFNYPYRWAVGRAEDLTEIDGHLYLMPGERGIVTGRIRITAPLGERNPQPVWAGLIHEDVEVSQFNNRVDPHAILIDLPDAENMINCPARDIPQPKE